MLAKMYGWTFEQIANMTSYAQYVALVGDKYNPDDDTLTFNTEEEYHRYLQNVRRRSG